MELRHLHYFLKIAEASSFTRAAAALHVTQPTLSHQIKQLEHEVTVPLFDRVGRRVRLTQAGKIFQDHARRCLLEISSGLRAISELNGLVRGQLTVGVFRTFSSSPLPYVLARFSHQYPGIQVKVRQLSLRDIERELVEGSMDVAIAYLPANSERIATEPLFAVPLALVVNKEHPLFDRKRVALQDLNDQPLVLLSEEFPLRQLIDRRLKHHGVKPRIVMEMNSNEAVLSTIRTGPLATILTERVLSDPRQLHSVELKDPELTRTAAIFWARDNYRPLAARALAELVKEAYADSGGRALPAMAGRTDVGTIARPPGTCRVSPASYPPRRSS